MSYTDVMKERHLVTLWLSQIFSCVGDQLYSIATIWIAVKIGGAEAGFVSAAGSVTGMCIGLVGGVYADRWNRRNTMLATDLLRALTVFALAITAHFIHLSLWHLAVASIITSALSSLFDPALNASVPLLAGSESKLQAMNALMLVNHRLARTIGPGAAGLLVTLVPIHHFFTLDGITFLVSALAIFSIGTNYQWKVSSSQSDSNQLSGTKKPSILEDLKSSWRVTSAHTELKWTLVIYFGSGLAWASSYLVGFPLWAKANYGDNVGAYGALVAAYGAGAVACNIAMGLLKTRKRMFYISMSNLTFVVGLSIMAYTKSLPIAALGAAIASTGGPMSDIFLAQMIQTEIPKNHMGKIFSFRTFVITLGGTIGLVSAPWLYDNFGSTGGLLACAGAFLVCGAIGLIRFGMADSPPVVLQGNDEASTEDETALQDVTT